MLGTDLLVQTLDLFFEDLNELVELDLHGRLRASTQNEVRLTLMESFRLMRKDLDLNGERLGCGIARAERPGCAAPLGA